MDLNIIIIIAGISVLTALGVLIYRFVNKKFIEAYKNAKNFTLLSTKEEDRETIFNDLEKFQKNIFTKSQRAYLDKIDNKIAEKKSEVKTLTAKLSELKLEKKEIDSENDQIKLDEIDKKIVTIQKQYDAEITSILTQIEKHTNDLLELQNQKDKFLKDKFKPVAEGGNATTNSIKKNVDRFVKLFPYYIFIILDYFIAVSFFQQYSQDLDKILQLVVGYAVPLAITIFSLILVEWLIHSFRNKKLFGIVVPTVLLGLIFFFIAYSRVDAATGQSEILIELLMFLIFLMTVSVIGYQFDKEKIGGFELISLPLSIFANLLQIVLSIVVSPVNKISTKVYDVTTPTPFDREIISKQKHIQELKNKVTYLRSEQTKLPEKSVNQQNEARQRLKETRVNRLNDITKEIGLISSKISQINKDLQKMDEMDNQIIKGSNEGTIAGLRAVFKIKG